MGVSLGPEGTKLQQRQREDTERAAELLRKAGIRCSVLYLWCGHESDDAATIVVEKCHD